MELPEGRRVLTKKPSFCSSFWSKPSFAWIVWVNIEELTTAEVDIAAQIELFFLYMLCKFAL